MNGFTLFGKIKNMSNVLLPLTLLTAVAPIAHANTQAVTQPVKNDIVSLDSLTNYQINNSFMQRVARP